jgi:hypothetical protein
VDRRGTLRLAGACGLWVTAAACGSGDQSTGPIEDARVLDALVAVDARLPDAGSPQDARPQDAAPTPDAPPACTIALNFEDATPFAPTTVTVRAESVAGEGLSVASWSVRGPLGEIIAVSVVDARQITFPAADPGDYVVSASGFAPGLGTCSSGPHSHRVADGSVNHVELRLRYFPQPGQGVPEQDEVPIVVSGGRDLALPPRALVDVVTIAGRVMTSPAGGLPAYLRLESGRGLLELFTDGTGFFSGQVLHDASYDVTVVPYDAAFAPLLIPGMTATTLEGGITIQPGDAFTVRVRDADGAPVADARVAAAIGAMPPGVAVTGSDGAAALRVRAAGQPLALVVTPPLPQARVEIVPADGLTVGAGGTVDVQLARVDTARLSLTARDAAGAPLTGAALRLSAALEAEASVAVDGGAAIARPSSVRLAALAGALGVVPPLTLPRGGYEVILDGAGRPAREVLQLDGDREAVVAAAPPATLQVAVRAGGAAVAGARVRAVAAGLRGVGAGATLSATTPASGEVALQVVADMPYDLVVDPPAELPRARGRARVVAGAAAAAVEIALPAAVTVAGTVRSPIAAPLAGVRVEVVCAGCPTPEVVIAEDLTGADGGFVLRVPDPGPR